MWLNFSYFERIVFFLKKMFQYDLLFRETKEFIFIVPKAEVKSGQGLSLK